MYTVCARVCVSVCVYTSHPSCIGGCVHVCVCVCTHSLRSCVSVANMSKKLSVFACVVLCINAASPPTIRELIAQTEKAKEKFLKQTALVDTELKSVVGSRPVAHSSFVQTQSQLKLESQKFESTKKSILAKDGSLLETKKHAFDESLNKLKSDAKTFLGKSSFLQENDSSMTDRIKEFFEPARQVAEKVHSVVKSILASVPGQVDAQEDVPVVEAHVPVVAAVDERRPTVSAVDEHVTPAPVSTVEGLDIDIN